MALESAFRSEVFGVFDEVEEVGVGAGEFGFGVDAEGVIPDDPGAVVAGAELALEDEFEFSGEIVGRWRTRMWRWV